ncbi:ABC transporter ATP-binding protein [Candidatus Dependentiae bacterium]|nr:ABC transporter ATP-binding protein [Candidatus Dependentiae bacterium]
MNAIEVNNIKYSYLDGIKKISALNNVSFKIKEGCVAALMGVNGAGKTTTIKCILNFITPDSGEISIFDKKSSDSESRITLSYLPEKVNLTSELTLAEHFRFLGKIYKISKNDTLIKMKKLSELTKLEHLIDTRVSRFSKGQSQRAGIALSLFNDPKLLILDEPMTGLDPFGQKLIIDIIKSVKQNITLLVSTHSFEFVRKVADNILIINKGSVVADIENKADIADIENKFYQVINNE